MGKKNDLKINFVEAEGFKINGRKYTAECRWGTFLSWLPRVIALWGGNESIFDIAEDYTPAFVRITEFAYFDKLGGQGITHASPVNFLDFLISTGLIVIKGEKPTRYGIKKLTALSQLILDKINGYTNSNGG